MPRFFCLSVQRIRTNLTAKAFCAILCIHQKKEGNVIQTTYQTPACDIVVALYRGKVVTQQSGTMVGRRRADSRAGPLGSRAGEES